MSEIKMSSIDGNTAAAYVAYAFSENLFIYPITPATPMSALCDLWSAQKKPNAFGDLPQVIEMQSEIGVAGAVFGSLCCGALTGTFTTSQGLMLMVPAMYQIAGAVLPTVFHIAARSVAHNSLSVYAEHADVYATRQTGFCMLASSSVQECMDLALVAHLGALKQSTAYLHFFDGFRTSHEISKIAMIDYEDMRSLVDMNDVKSFKDKALNPEHPTARASVDSEYVYFTKQEIANKLYLETPNVVQDIMDKVGALTGRHYQLFNYFGAPDATNVVVALGSVCGTLEEVAENLIKTEHKKVGVLKVSLFKPFDVDRFIAALPKTVRRIAVLERYKELGSDFAGSYLYFDVCAAFNSKGIKKRVIAGRFGLGGRNFDSSMAYAVYKNLAAVHPKNNFTVGIEDDVTNTSLDYSKKYFVKHNDIINCKFWGIGADGTVGANKNVIKIIGDYTNKYIQGYFAYEAKKSGGYTISNLRFGDSPIKAEYDIDGADIVQCSKAVYLKIYDMISEIKPGGIFLLNSPARCAKDLEDLIPAKAKNYLAKNKIKFYAIDANAIARSIGLKDKTSTILQSAFFKLANIIPYNEAVEYMKKMAYKTFYTKGEAVVNMNYAAIDSADQLVEINIPKAWATTTKDIVVDDRGGNVYYNKIMKPSLNLTGASLPTSAYPIDNVAATGTTHLEKRGVGTLVPQWDASKCVQCNKCSFSCAHAAIRPVAITSDTKHPEDFKTKPMIGKPGFEFRMQCSPLDCQSCGVCAQVCPVGALTMKPLEEVAKTEVANFEFSQTLPELSAEKLGLNEKTVKGLQFNVPYFEYSAACAGCGEAAHIKTLTQLFGAYMIDANGTGCSCVYGNSTPTVPYARDARGHGPAYSNSLFENGAEYGYGMAIAYIQRRKYMKNRLAQLIEALSSEQGKEVEALRVAHQTWIDTYSKLKESTVASEELVVALENYQAVSSNQKELISKILDRKDCLAKKSVWVIGGDGFAYDIGYAGLDHVLARGDDINFLIIDNELYANTGGQTSKATPRGSASQFAAAGKTTKKKDLGTLFINYGNIYVASCAMGANPQQYINALVEAEQYEGPSMVIVYCPCINHGINMAEVQLEEKKAVECGYWGLYRYNPTLAKEGKNPFTLDCKDPNGKYQEYLMGENRYKSLTITYPENAKKLFAQSEADSMERFNKYKELAQKEVESDIIAQKKAYVESCKEDRSC